MKVLVCTHHLLDWGVSEQACLGLFNALVEKGFSVRVFCPFASPVFTQKAFGDWTVVESDPREIDIRMFDLVFVFQQGLSRLLEQNLAQLLSDDAGPIIAYFHLSSSDQLEVPGPFLERSFGDLIYADGPETLGTLKGYGVSNARQFRSTSRRSLDGASEDAHKKVNEPASEDLCHFFPEDRLDEILQDVMGASKNRQVSGFGQKEIAHQVKLEKALFALVDQHYAGHHGLPQIDDFEVGSGYQIEARVLRQPKHDEPMVIAAFSYRYDAHLVPSFLENISPFVHGYVALDDRGSDAPMSDESGRQRALFRAARSLGAKWIFVADPDERFEDRLAQHMKPLTTRYGPVMWTFECRELFHPSRYRIDGVWAGRPRLRLFPCIAGMEPDDRPLHGQWTKNSWELPMQTSGLDFYHLRMIEPARRRLRKALYSSADPERQYQNIGYDYLDDERGMVLIDVPAERAYSPPHIEDGELWAASQQQLDSNHSSVDPLPQKMKLLSKNLTRGAYTNAKFLARDARQFSPDDLELALLEAENALRAGHFQDALDTSQKVAEESAEPLHALILSARAHHALGNQSEAGKALADAKSYFPFFDAGVPEISALKGCGNSLKSKEALWRRWSTSNAEVHEGEDIEKNNLAVVVIGLHAPDDLRDAVASLVGQSIRPEIVVVNSGGGDPKAVLAEYLNVIRIINLEERLFAGAARNIGIDASSSPFVSFLASDCQVLPGWVEARLALHKAGYLAVSSSVEPQPDSSSIELLASLLIHPLRHPNSGSRVKVNYSLSYDRRLFESHGYFPTGLRIGEDSYLNNKLSDLEIGTDPRIQLIHKYPENLDELRQDIVRRAKRSAFYDRFHGLEREQRIKDSFSKKYEWRQEASLQALEGIETISDAERVQLRSQIQEMLNLDQEVFRSTSMQVLRAKKMAQEAETLAQSDLQGACSLIERAIETWSQSSSLHILASEIFSKSSDPEKKQKAIEHARKALEIDPSAHTALFAAMKLLIEQGQLLDACREFLKAYAMEPRRVAINSAARLLSGPKFRPFRLMMWQKAFFLAPQKDSVGRTIGNTHKMIGNFKASEARQKFSVAATVRDKK